MSSVAFHRKDHLQKHFQSHSKKFMRQGVSVDDVVAQVKTERDEDLNPMILNVCGNVAELDVSWFTYFSSNTYSFSIQ